MNLIKHKPSAGSRLSGIERYNRRWGLLLISPWLIGVIIFKLGPILASLVLSLTDFMLLDPGQTQFIGLQNYIKIFQDSDFWFVLSQTIFLAVLIIPVQTCSSILLATVLSHRRLKMKNTIRSLFYLPSIIPSTAALLVTDGFINPTSGWLNRLILGPFGLAGLNTLYTKNSEIIVFALTSMWAIGPGFLIIMAALQKIPGEIHEAARLDGANPLVHYLAITLPLVSPSIFFCLVINLTAAFGGAILLDRGFTFGTKISSLANYLHMIMFDKFRMGYASGVAWVFFLIVTVLVVLLFGTSKRWVYFPESKS